MDVRRGGNGFTLIEVMICIAILAILMAVPLSIRGTVRWLAHENDYRFALRNAQHELQALRGLAFDHLPPRVLKVPPGGQIDLGQADLVPGSVTVKTPEGMDLPVQRVDAAKGTLRLEPRLAGQAVVVDYRFFVPDPGEAYTVPEHAPFEVTLYNTPVTRVTSVSLLRGEAAEVLPSSEWRLDPASGRLTLPSRAAGRAVSVDYVGERIRNQVSGSFLSESLKPSPLPTRFKLLRIQEAYGDHTLRLTLSLVKVAP